MLYVKRYGITMLELRKIANLTVPNASPPIPSKICFVPKLKSIYVNACKIHVKPLPVTYPIACLINRCFDLDRSLVWETLIGFDPFGGAVQNPPPIKGRLGYRNHSDDIFFVTTLQIA